MNGKFGQISKSLNYCNHDRSYNFRNETKADVDHIRRAINEFSWEISFENNSVNRKVNRFNITIKNILSNYIPDETITCDNRAPLWNKISNN